MINSKPSSRARHSIAATISAKNGFSISGTSTAHNLCLARAQVGGGTMRLIAQVVEPLSSPALRFRPQLNGAGSSHSTRSQGDTRARLATSWMDIFFGPANARAPGGSPQIRSIKTFYGKSFYDAATHPSAGNPRSLSSLDTAENRCREIRFGRSILLVLQLQGAPAFSSPCSCDVPRCAKVGLRSILDKVPRVGIKRRLPVFGSRLGLRWFIALYRPSGFCSSPDHAAVTRLVFLAPSNSLTSRAVARGVFSDWLVAARGGGDPAPTAPTFLGTVARTR